MPDPSIRRLQLAFRVDDLGAPLAFGLGLPRDGPDHRLVPVHMLDFQGLDALGRVLVRGLAVLTCVGPDWRQELVSVC